MFNLKHVLLVAAAAAAMPHPHPRPRSLDLSAMINHTVCAITVTYNEDPNRVPRRIKMLECAANTDHWCMENNIKQHDCCHHRHMTECVQMTDQVVVFNTARNSTESLEVAVGCACMIRRSTLAPGPPAPP